MAALQAQERKHFFFEKKKQKTFPGSLCNRDGMPRRQRRVTYEFL